MSSKEASAILDSVHKKTKVFGCNLENYLKVSLKVMFVASCLKTQDTVHTLAYP